MSYEPVKDETKEHYLKIWTHYAVGNFSQTQLAKLFDCNEETVLNAINWVAENRTQFNSVILVEAAKTAVEAKLGQLGNDLIRIKDKEPINWNAAIGIERLILENRQLLWKLQAVIQDKSLVTINNTLQINQVLKARDELMEVSDDKRQQILSSFREIINRPESVQEGTDRAIVVSGTPGV